MDIDDDGNTDNNSKDDINNDFDAGHNNMGYNFFVGKNVNMFKYYYISKI